MRREATGNSRKQAGQNLKDTGSNVIAESMQLNTEARSNRSNRSNRLREFQTFQRFQTFQSFNGSVGSP